MTLEPHECSRLETTVIIVPTLNAGVFWNRLRAGLDAQGVSAEQILIVDSTSSDGTSQLARDAGYQVLTIPRGSFTHGATRQMAAEYVHGAEFIAFMTQDAILCHESSLSNLIRAFDSRKVGAAYGRQVPRPEAGPIERHGRLFNYPYSSGIRSFDDRKKMGFRTTFMSNAFGAYRRIAFDQVGGFPRDVIVSEDVSLAARLLVARWEIAYCADAEVFHSHALNFCEEFSRYFDIAVHHSQEPWLFETFGTAGSDGKAFVLSELRYLFRYAPHLLPAATLRNASKWLAYHLGLKEHFLPLRVKRLLSHQQNFWNQEDSFEIQVSQEDCAAVPRTRSGS